jgi:hypothetical protein
MRTNILLTMVLMAGMMLAGCAKEDGSEESRKGNDMEQTLTKEQIVGVWRSGDYWVSFSESGFMCAYLSDKCIAEGDYAIDGDTVKIDDGFKKIRAYGKNTRFVINSISNGTLSLTATYNDLSILYDGDEGLVHLHTQNYNFSKTQESPCVKSNSLIGKSCVIPLDVWHYQQQPLGPFVLESVPGTCTLTVESNNLINALMSPNVALDDGFHDHVSYMYVYLSPKLYMISMELYPGLFERERPMKIYEPTFGLDGSLTIPFTYPDDIDNYL